MTCRRPGRIPHAHCQMLMPVMISPRSARDSLACAVPAAARPTLKCTFSQHGGCLSRLRTSAAAQTRGPAPPSPALQAKGPEPQNLARPARSSRPSGWKRKFSLGGNGSLASPALLCPRAILLSASALGIPSHQPGGCAVRGWIVGWAPYAYLGNSIQFALDFSAPNNSPHFTAVCPPRCHARNTGV